VGKWRDVRSTPLRPPGFYITMIRLRRVGTTRLDEVIFETVL
jgi:hypothetical protein